MALNTRVSFKGTFSRLLATAFVVFAALSASASGTEDTEVLPIDSAFADAIEIAQLRTVKIYGGSIGRTPGYATGLLVSQDGQIVTAQGAYLATDNLRVTLTDGTTHPAKVLRRSLPLQAALLKIDLTTPHFYTLTEKSPAAQGDWVLAVSNAFKVADGAEPLSVNIGVLSLRTQLDARRGFQDFPYEGEVYLYDAITSNPGAAGGAVVTAEGKLVGMIGKVIESKSTNTRLNYAVPADLLASFVAGKEAVASSTSNPASGPAPELGIRLFALGGRKSPAYIDRVIPNSPAAIAGLRGDDLIVSIGDQVVHDASEFRRITASLKAGQEFSIEIKRKDQLLSLRLKLGETQ
jgi:serine protease Do